MSYWGVEPVRSRSTNSKGRDGKPKVIGYKVRYPDPNDPTRWRTARYDDAGNALTSEAKARAYLARLREDVRRGTYLDPDRAGQSLEEWSRQWLRTRRHLRAKTVEGYESLLNSRILPTFGRRRLRDISRVHVEQWVSAMVDEGLSPSRIRNAYRLLNACLKAAVLDGALVRNPAQSIALPRLKPSNRRALDAGQLAVLADAVPDRYRALVYVLGYGGLRFGEAVALRRESVDLLRGRVMVTESATVVRGGLTFGPTKTHADRSVSLPPFVVDLVTDHLDTYTGRRPDDFLFTNERGGPLRPDYWPRTYFRPAAERAVGVPDDLTPHELRHTAASLLIAQGANPKAVQAHLGHSTIATTFDVYGHLFDNALDDVMAKLDEAHREGRGRGSVATLRRE